MSKNLYSLTPEHQEILNGWKDQWIANAFSTGRMTDDEKRICKDAAEKMYAFAGLEKPRVVFVPSPFVLKFASGFAAALWHIRKTGFKPAQATAQAAAQAAAQATQATAQATQATAQATVQAVHATDQATDQATAQAVQATVQAVQATVQAFQATVQAFQATDQAEKFKEIFVGVSIHTMINISRNLGIGDFGIKCAARFFSYYYYRWGNMASGWLARLSFYRDVAKIDIDWSKHQPWETLGKNSGFRIMHPEFCMISEKPIYLELDEMYQPHCDNGPYIRWSDGTGIYATHGVLHSAWITEFPDQITLEKIEAEENMDIRQVMISKFGEEKYLTESGAKVVHHDEQPIRGGVDGVIRRVLMRDKNGGQFMLTHDGSTDRAYALAVSPTAKNCREAHYSISGFWDEDCLANS